MTPPPTPTRTPVPAPAPAPAPAPPSDAAAPRPLSRTRRALRALAIASCVPYLAIKIAWIFGSSVGIPDGSPLLDHRVTMVVANVATALMDAAVIVLALLLTQAWGRRVRPWLLALPMWLATGLLAPIMLGFPLQLLVGALGSTSRGAADTGREPFLDAWVFGVVYGGFILQGLTLGTLFVLYARDRWAHLWRGRVGDLPTSASQPARRTAAVTAAVLALIPAALNLMWAFGSTAGLNEGRIADRTSDFSVTQAEYALFALCAAAGALMLAFRIGRALPLHVPLALAWVGSGATACWGGWLVLGSLVAGDDVVNRPTQVMNLSYAVQMIVGTLVVALVASFLAERAAAKRRA
ncbi:hypothetical protein [Streptomyces apocyni]|uniref:hypothetical protein n=1 Tax=Streptomyces apocyni TaxID=2654677 RepID=UPI001E526F65|nr:hypothetical protein [Streptomyces apocyni]